MGFFSSIGKSVKENMVDKPGKEWSEYWDKQLDGSLTGALRKGIKNGISSAKKKKKEEKEAAKATEMEMSQTSYGADDVSMPKEQAAPQVIIKGPSAMSKLAGSFDSMVDQANKQQDDRRQTQQSLQDKVNEIAAMQFTVSDVSVLQQEIQNLITLAQGQNIPLIVPIGDKSPKEIVAAAKSKIQFGIMQLRSQDKNVEADFFEKELSKGNLKKVK